MTHTEVAGGAEAQSNPLDDLRAAADAGDASATAELGARLLVSGATPANAREGVARIAQAAGRDDPGAMTLLATTVAAGAVAAPDWPRALDLMERAAALGSQSARAQLQLLAGAPAETDWRDLRARIDVEAWKTPPARRPLTESPRVRMAENFAPAAVCDWLVQRGRGRMRPANMDPGAPQTRNIGPHRTRRAYPLGLLLHDALV